MEYNISIIGPHGSGRGLLATKLGKLGTESNVQLYNSEQDPIINSIVPHTYPDKIEPLIQSISISDLAIVSINPEYEADYQLGEHIILLDYLQKPTIFVVNQSESENTFLADQWKTKIGELIANTSLKDSSILSVSVKDKDSIEKLINKIKEIKIKPIENTLFLVDHFFEVKSVGTVFLGTLKGGAIDAYNKLPIYPPKTEVLVKSIQVMDVDHKHVEFPTRAGLAVKGIDVKDMKRGFVMSDKELQVSDSFELNYEKCPFYKDELMAGQKLRFGHGAQVVDATIVSVSADKINLKLEKQLAIYENNSILFRADISGQLRIIGKVKH